MEYYIKIINYNYFTFNSLFHLGLINVEMVVKSLIFFEILVS